MAADHRPLPLAVAAEDCRNCWAYNGVAAALMRDWPDIHTLCCPVVGRRYTPVPAQHLPKVGCSIPECVCDYLNRIRLSLLRRICLTTVGAASSRLVGHHNGSEARRNEPRPRPCWCEQGSRGFRLQSSSSRRHREAPP